MNKPLFKGMRVLSCALVLVLLIGCVPYFMSRAQTVADLREEKAALEAKIASLESKKNALSGDLSDQKAKKEAIDEQIELKKQQIALNDSMIYELNVQINENQTAISNSEKEIADREDSIKARFAALQERLRVVSKTGNMSLLQMLFDTDNYVDYLLKSKLMKTIAAND